MSEELQNHPILIVASDPQVRAEIRAALGPGWNILVRQSVERALQLLEQTEVGLVICATQLEDGSCVEMTQALRHESMFIDLPLHLVVEETVEALAVQALELGADDASFRPLKSAVFAAKAARVLRTKLQARQNPVTLSVRLDASQVPGVMQFLEAERKTGLLKASSGKNHAELTFKQGRIVKAETEFCAGSQAVTEILAWPYCQMRFFEIPVEGDGETNMQVSSALMDCVFEVDEYRAAQDRLGDPEQTFVQGTQTLPSEANKAARQVIKFALSGQSMQEILDSVRLNRRHLVLLMDQLVQKDFLRHAPPPLSQWRSQVAASMLQLRGRTRNFLAPLERQLINLDLSKMKTWDQLPIRHVDADASELPTLILAGDNPAATEKVFRALVVLAGAFSGGKAAMQSKRANEANTILELPGGCIALVKLPPKLDSHYLRQVGETHAATFAQILVASSAEREIAAGNRTRIKLLSDAFAAPLFVALPPVSDASVRNGFIIDCPACTHRLTLDMDEAGSIGGCPICESEMVVPEALAHAAQALRLPYDIPCIALDGGNADACELLALCVCDALSHSKP